MKTRTLILSLFFIGSFLVFVQANAPSLDSDGIHYAAVAKEMCRTGRLLLPYDPVVEGHYYFHFPLSVWPTALIFKLFGVSPATAKLYSMLMTLAAVAGIFVLGRILANPWVGWYGGLSFLFTNHVLRIARQCRVDLPLIGFMVWAFVGLVLAQRGSRFWYLFMGVMCLGAIMTKEVVGLVPLTAGAAYFILRRQWKELSHPAFLLAWGLAIGPVIGWVMLEKALYQTTLWQNYHQQNFAFLMGAEHLAKPWYYYGWAILDKYWYFLPLTAIGGWIAWKKIRSGEEPRWGMIFLWAVALPLGFSLARHKVHYYILPSYAATSLLLGLACERLVRGAWRRRLVMGISGLALSGAVVLASFPIPVHTTRYAANIQVAPRIDAIMKNEPGEVIVARQDVASLLFYSKEVTRVLTAHEWHRFQDLLNHPTGSRRYLLIGEKDWDQVDPELRLRWRELLRDGDRWFLREEPVPATGGLL